MGRPQAGITVIETAAYLTLALVVICIILIIVSEQLRVPGSNQMRL